MANKTFHTKTRAVVMCLLSFVLSIMLFVLSLCVVLTATLFNPHFILNNIDKTEYYSYKCEEITEDLIDLGYASGLNEEFFDGLIDTEMISIDTGNYIQDYYSGESIHIDLTNFKETFNTALDEYIKENNITEVDEQNRNYLVNNAAAIYRYSLDLPFFGRLSSYFQFAKKGLPIAVIVLSLLSAGICVVFFISNTRKHLAVKYICHATSGAFLALVVIPVLILFSDILNKINFSAQSLYHLFLQCGNSLCTAFFIGSALLLIVSIVLFIQYKILHKKQINKTIKLHPD